MSGLLLYLCRNGGEKVDVQLDPDDSVTTLSNRAQQLWGPCWRELRYQGAILESGLALADAGVCSQSVVEVIWRIEIRFKCDFALWVRINKSITVDIPVKLLGRVRVRSLHDDQGMGMEVHEAPEGCGLTAGMLVCTGPFYPLSAGVCGYIKLVFSTHENRIAVDCQQWNEPVSLLELVSGVSVPDLDRILPALSVTEASENRPSGLQTDDEVIVYTKDGVEVEDGDDFISTGAALNRDDVDVDNVPPQNPPRLPAALKKLLRDRLQAVRILAFPSLTVYTVRPDPDGTMLSAFRETEIAAEVLNEVKDDDIRFQAAHTQPEVSGGATVSTITDSYGAAGQTGMGPAVTVTSRD